MEFGSINERLISLCLHKFTGQDTLPSDQGVAFVKWARDLGNALLEATESECQTIQESVDNTVAALKNGATGLAEVLQISAFSASDSTYENEKPPDPLNMTKPKEPNKAISNLDRTDKKEDFDDSLERKTSDEAGSSFDMTDDEQSGPTQTAATNAAIEPVTPRRQFRIGCHGYAERIRTLSTENEPCLNETIAGLEDYDTDDEDVLQ